MFVYKHKHEKKICDKLLRKDLSKVDSGPKTRSVQSENLKKLANLFSSYNPSLSLPSVKKERDSKQSQGCNIVSRKQIE